MADCPTCRPPLRADRAPTPGCDCRICMWARGRMAESLLGASHGPVRPGTPAWDVLMAVAR